MVSYRSVRRSGIMPDCSRVRASRRLPMESGHQIETSNTAYFRHGYDSEHADMRRLYEQAKIDQWNAATDIDWACPLDGDGGLIADDLVDIHGTKFWDRLSPMSGSNSIAMSAGGGSRP